MATIKIDNIDYRTDNLSEEAKAQLVSLEFCDQEPARYFGDASLLTEDFPDHSKLVLLLQEVLAWVSEIKMNICMAP